MSVLLITLLILAILELGISIYKVPADQRTINAVNAIILILLICYVAGWLKF